MNQAIADIIKSHIEGLDFVDKIAGLTRVLTFDIVTKDSEGKNVPVQKSFPVACCVTADDCKDGAYNELMPNSQYKTVIYFEDMGVTAGDIEGRYSYFTSNVRLVCWINAAKILGDTCKTGTACTLSAHLIAEIIRALPEFKQHHNPFNMVLSKVVSQEVSSPSIFSQYTYDEKHTQYLMYPYDYFALDIQTEFAICLKGTGVYDSDCGHRTDSLDAPVATAGTGATSSSFIAHCNAVTGATGYAIDVATDSGFTDFVLRDERIGNSRDVTITDLDQGTTYYYRFRAYNDFTESESSNVITISTIQTTFSDWFLPSQDELAAMYTELYLYGVGGFLDTPHYWSSTELAATLARSISYTNGSNNVAGKLGSNYLVRACRSFTSTTNYSLRSIGPAGGLIFYKNGNNYLEASPSNLGLSLNWSNVNSLIGATAQGTAIGTGQANTTAIIGQVGHTASAAKLCNDLVVNNP